MNELIGNVSQLTKHSCEETDRDSIENALDSVMAKFNLLINYSCT